MRAGWNEHDINAPLLARMAQDAGAAAVAVHGRTAAQSYSGESDWSLIARVAAGISIPVFGSGDCVEPDQVVARLRESNVAGVLVGRGALRNPWIFRQASDAADGRTPEVVPLEARGQFLLDYMDLLIDERVDEAAGFRHIAPGHIEGPPPEARGRERWVINKIRALGSWYTKGLDGGGQLRVAINSSKSIPELRETISSFFRLPVYS
jgi:tRNA-dihydrouridine synthase B